MLYEYCFALDTLISLTKITNGSRGGLHTVILVREACPACGSQRFKKNGHIHNADVVVCCLGMLESHLAGARRAGVHARGAASSGGRPHGGIGATGWPLHPGGGDCKKGCRSLTDAPQRRHEGVYVLARAPWAPWSWRGPKPPRSMGRCRGCSACGTRSQRPKEVCTRGPR
jgi:hypothetical protein